MENKTSIWQRIIFKVLGLPPANPKEIIHYTPIIKAFFILLGVFGILGILLLVFGNTIERITQKQKPLNILGQLFMMWLCFKFIQIFKDRYIKLFCTASGITFFLKALRIPLINFGLNSLGIFIYYLEIVALLMAVIFWFKEISYLNKRVCKKS